MKLKFLLILLVSLLVLVPVIVESAECFWFDDTANSGFLIYQDCDCSDCNAANYCYDLTGCSGDGVKPDPLCPPACLYIAPALDIYKCGYGNPECDLCGLDLNPECCQYENFDLDIAKCQGCLANGTTCYAITCTGSGWACRGCTCDSSCPGVSSDCDGLAIGDPCGVGRVCSSTCQCEVASNICDQLKTRMDNSFGMRCGDPAYDPIADVNKDTIVDISDLAQWSICGGDEVCCQGLWDETDPCPLPPAEIGGLVPCGRRTDDPDTDLDETAPCTLCHLFVLFKRITDGIMVPYVFLFAILMTVVGGIILQTASGDPGRISQGKNILKATIIGLVIILVSWLIVNTIIVFLTPAGSPFQAWHTIDCPPVP